MQPIEYLLRRGYKVHKVSLTFEKTFLVQEPQKYSKNGFSDAKTYAFKKGTIFLEEGQYLNGSMNFSCLFGGVVAPSAPFSVLLQCTQFYNQRLLFFPQKFIIWSLLGSEIVQCIFLGLRSRLLVNINCEILSEV